jgi:hypothetical protein
MHPFPRYRFRGSFAVPPEAIRVTDETQGGETGWW